MASVYSAGSASVNIVPDFTNAQKRIGEWFARQKDLKVSVKPDIDNVALAATKARVEATHPKMHVGIDHDHLAKDFVKTLDILTGTSTVHGALRRIFDVKPILMASMGGAVTALAANISQVVGATALAPAAVAALVAPLSAAIVGFQGIGTAFSSFGDPKKLAAAMKDLAPAARDVVTQTHALAGAWKDLRLDVQERLFAGLGDKIATLGEKGLPVLRRGLAGMADELNVLFGGIMDSLSSDANLADIGHTFDNLKTTFHEVALAAKPFFDALISLTSVGSDFLPGLVAGLAAAAQHFADFINSARQSGDLQRFISAGLSGIGDLLKIVGNLGSAIGGIFKAAMPAGTALMNVLKEFTGGLADFLHTDVAKSGLRLFFDGVYQAIQAVLPGIQALVGAIVTGVLPAMAGFAKAVAPVVNGVLTEFAGLLETLAPLFYPALAEAVSAALGALAPLISTFGEMAKVILPPLISLVDDLAPRFSALAEAVGQALVTAVRTLAPLLPKIHDAFVAIVDALTPMVTGGLNLANAVLPVLVTVFGALLDALKFIAPILPAVLAGFLAFKAVSLLSSIFTGLATGLLNMALNVERIGTGGALTKMINGLLGAAGAAEGLAAALSTGLGLALGVVAFAIGGIVLGIQAHNKAVADATQEVLGWYKAVASGGADAPESYKKILDKQKELAEAQKNLNNLTANQEAVYQQAGRGAGAYAAAITAAKGKVDDLKKELTDSKAALTPLEQAEYDVAAAIFEHGANSDEAAAATSRFVAVQAQQKQIEEGVAAATQSTIDKIKARMDITNGQADAQLRYDNAMADLKTSTTDYVQSLNDWTLSDDEHAAAERTFRQTVLDSADAAKAKALADNAGKSATDQAKAANDAYLKVLLDTQNQIGAGTDPALDALIAKMQANATQADYTKSKFEGFGLAVKEVPDDKTVIINAPTDKQVADLQALGYKVEHLPNGDVIVTADTNPAQAEIAAVVSARYNAYVSLHLTNSGADVVNAVRNIEHSGGGEIGGILERYATGGFHMPSLFPMKGGVATVVKPNTWRVIGDRAQDDEAYIPINDSPRSARILDETAGRMGYDLVPRAVGSLDLLPPGIADTFRPDISHAADSRRLAKTERMAGGAPASVAGFVNNGTVLTTDLSELARKSRIGTQRALAKVGIS